MIIPTRHRALRNGLTTARGFLSSHPIQFYKSEPRKFRSGRNLEGTERNRQLTNHNFYLSKLNQKLPKTRLHLSDNLRFHLPFHLTKHHSSLRHLHTTQRLQFNPLVDTILQDLSEEPEDESHKSKPKPDSKFISFLIKCAEAMGITFSSIAILGVAGLLYHKFYHLHVLSKMDDTFEKGDPASHLAIHSRTHDESQLEEIDQFWVERPQQKLLDGIISGSIVGRYFLIVGEKGTGKTSLLLEAIKKTEGYNVTMFDAHADPEIFRLRLGKALNFAYNEDYIGSLFSIKGPRDTTALLDIERAFGKLEELAIKRVPLIGRPLIVIINNSHLIKENEEGVKLLELLQQKAESLSGSGLVTIIFNSDDYWVYEKLKKLGTRLELINVRDFTRTETVNALKYIRHKYFPEEMIESLEHSNRERIQSTPESMLDSIKKLITPDSTLETLRVSENTKQVLTDSQQSAQKPAQNSERFFSDELCHQIYDLIGGRPQHISQVARHRDIITACNEIIDREKTWFLNQCGLLGNDMDDDVMESGKFSTSAMLLMREFVEMDRKRSNNLIVGSVDCNNQHDHYRDHHLPELPLWRSRQIMTRADYIQQYDNLNVFTIDSESRVRADSVPMMRAFHEIATLPNFDKLLEDSMQRVADIESLGRTREVVAKDLNMGSKYRFKSSDGVMEMMVEKSKKQADLHGDFDDVETEKGRTSIEDFDGDDDDEELYLEGVHRKEHKKWWKKRIQLGNFREVDKGEFDLDLSRRS